MAALAVLLLPFAAPSQASAGSHSRFEARVIAEINAVRAQHGVAGIRHRRMLARAASRHSRRLLRAGRLFHSSTRRLARRAHGPVGEVVAWSTRRRTSPRSVVAQWMNSPPHRAVLLDGRFHRVGIGARTGRRGLFVTGDFAR